MYHQRMPSILTALTSQALDKQTIWANENTIYRLAQGNDTYSIDQNDSYIQVYRLITWNNVGLYYIEYYN